MKNKMEIKQDKAILVVHGISTIDAIPEIQAKLSDVTVRCAPDLEALRSALPGAEVLLGWNFEAEELKEAWEYADQLKWIQWGGAGVDAVLFPELVDSDVILTNMRGIFDRAIAEYVLGLILAFAKDFPETYNAQRERRWSYRFSDRIENSRILVIGTGGIGRMIGQILGAVGCHVSGVARTERSGDDVFDFTYSIKDLDQALTNADYVVIAAPLTEETKGFFGTNQFAQMRKNSYFINVGRGSLVDELALIKALQSQQIAGAALDVFQTEPLPRDNPLWRLENVIVSPHMSGDYDGHKSAMANLFLDNLDRYRKNEALLNRIDKKLGFIASKRT